MLDISEVGPDEVKIVIRDVREVKFDQRLPWASMERAAGG